MRAFVCVCVCGYSCLLVPMVGSKYNYYYTMFMVEVYMYMYRSMLLTLYST